MSVPRYQRLKERLIHTRPRIESERARLVTASYRESRGKPMSIRRALVLDRLLRHMTIGIGPDELIVGYRSDGPRSSPQFPEMSVEWILDELDRFPERPVDQFITPEPVKEDLRRVLPFWRGRTVQDRASEYIPEETRKLFQYHVFEIDNNLQNGLGHILPDYETPLRIGFDGLKQRAAAQLEALDYLAPDAFERAHFLRAVRIVLDAGIAFARRYAVLAEALARDETETSRRRELEEIATVCRGIPARPAHTFREALQFVWFIQCFCFIESDGMSISPGRLDQYLYPYYARDIENGVETADSIQELIDCFWVKCSELVELFPEQWAYTASGFPMGQNVVVGGLTRDGDDATNELSYHCLEAGARLRLPQPNLSVRLHGQSPWEFRMRAAEVIKCGYGMPESFNDDIIIPSLLRRGIPLEDARDYAVVGCVEIAVPGKTEAYSNPANLNLPKVLELALHNGVDPRTGDQIGPRTGEPTSFAGFDELWQAFGEQLRYFTRHLVIACNAIERVHARLVPTPMLSALIQDCITRGRDVIDGGAVYNFSSPQGIGIATTTDSLAGIRDLVFEKKAIPMKELLAALAEDFRDREVLRQRLLTKAPKYGNDDEAADTLARRISQLYGREVEQYRNPRGGQFQGGLYSVSINVPMGRYVGATPDGRHATRPISDGVSPVHGVDTQGPTATCRSVARLDHVLFSNGTLLNVKLHPESIKDVEGTAKLCELIRSYFALGGMHVQFNVVSADILREAQAHPEAHRGLVVRVAGYSADFTELYHELQDDIIARTEHTFH